MEGHMRLKFTVSWAPPQTACLSREYEILLKVKETQDKESIHNIQVQLFPHNAVWFHEHSWTY